MNCDNYSWRHQGFFGVWTYSKKRYKSAKATALQQSLGTDEVYEYTTQFHPPRWLIKGAWSLRAVCAASGWTFKPRMMNVIPGGSKLFGCAERGDVQGIRELFASREASPFDCDERGFTVLHFAALSSVGLCRFLIEQGADASYKNQDGKPPAVVVSWRKLEDETGLDMLRLFLVEAEAIPPLTKFLFQDATFFRDIQNLVEPDYYARPLKERVSFAMTANFIAANAFRLAISLDSEIPVEAIKHREGNGDTLIHGLAAHIATKSSLETFRGTLMDEKALQGWRSILNELISKGADLFVINYNRRTPLLDFICYHILWNDPGLNNVITFTAESPMIVYWLGSLQACGIDLMQYGATEAALLKKGLTF